MTDAPKLLTEAEWHEYYAAVGVGWAITRKIVEGHRERGLIAPEPEPKPPVELALEKELQAAVFQSDYGKVSWSNGFRVGFMRGMELAQPTLTRERLREAVVKALPFKLSIEVVQHPILDDLHAALTKGTDHA